MAIHIHRPGAPPVILETAPAKKQRTTDADWPPARKILEWPLDKDGLFAVPTERLTTEQEIEIEHRRMNVVAVANYGDPLIAPETFDPTGAYLCGGRAAGVTPDLPILPCNKLNVLPNGTSECIWRKKRILARPNNSSCAKYDVARVCDPEMNRPGATGLEDDQLGYGETNNPLGWGCVRCRFSALLPSPNQAIRPSWCKEHGITIGETACCDNNEPIPRQR